MLKAIFLMIGLFLTSFIVHAGQMQQIVFEGNQLSIQHSLCQPQPVLQESIKLIIPFSNCAASSSELLPSHPTVKKIHWAQHDKKTVWVVVTLKPNYQFERQDHSNLAKFCFPKCHQSLSWHAQSVATFAKPQITLFELGNITFTMPLQNMGIGQFMDKSIGFVPKDIIRDGLPHFGSQRDDWLGKPRKHKGYDIYTNHINILAMADGEVIAVRTGKLAGIYIKLKHEKQIYSLYVHLTSVTVQEGDRVKQGQIIGRIDGASGNAVQPQLHLEIKPNDKSIDPLPLIELYYQNNAKISQKIQKYKKQIPALIRLREQKLQQYLYSSQK